MADNHLVTFYPAPGGRLDLIAGLRAWHNHGSLQSPLARILDPFEPETFWGSTGLESRRFDPKDIETLRPLAERFDVSLRLVSDWFTSGIELASYHHAEPPIMFWSYDPVQWGQGHGGQDEADAGLLAFARSARASYALTSWLGYADVRKVFVRNGDGYRFSLPPYDPHCGHSVRWVDVCPELGGVTPIGHLESNRIAKPFGYTRHVLAGCDADFPQIV